MDAKQTAVLIDTNVFVIDLRYRRDRNYRVNREFLKSVAERRIGYATVVNLLELCGILSFNLNERQLRELWFYFEERYGVAVLPDTRLEGAFPAVSIAELFDIIKKKTSFGDALVLSVAKRQLPSVSMMVTWDADYLKGKFEGEVLSPAEFQERFPSELDIL